MEAKIRTIVPPAAEMDNILDNIGLPYSTLNTQHATSGLIGSGDADILVSLKENHRPTEELCRGAEESSCRPRFRGRCFIFCLPIS